MAAYERGKMSASIFIAVITVAAAHCSGYVLGGNPVNSGECSD